MNVSYARLLGLIFFFMGERLAQSGATPAPAPAAPATPATPATTAAAKDVPATPPATKSATPAAPKAKPCNYQLLQMLRLEGVKPGQPDTTNYLCDILPKDNCCSETDQVKIVRQWNGLTKPTIEKFKEDMATMHINLLGLEKHLLGLQFSQIQFHFDQISWRRSNDQQCFNAKYMLEQNNYDLIKDSRNANQRIADAVSRAFVKLFVDGPGKGVIKAKPLRTLLDNYFKKELGVVNDIKLGGCFEPSIKATAERLSDVIFKELMALKEPTVILPLVPDKEVPEKFLMTKLQILPTINAALESQCKNTDMLFMRETISRIHMTTLMWSINTMFREFMTKQEVGRMNQHRNFNPDALILEIRDNVFADQAIYKYLGWFYFASSTGRYARVYRYLENRLLKVFTDTVMRSATLTNQSQNVFLQTVMKAFHEHALRSALEASYKRVYSSLLLIIGAERLIRRFYKPTKDDLPIEDFYKAYRRLIVNEPEVFGNWFLHKNCQKDKLSDQVNNRVWYFWQYALYRSGARYKENMVKQGELYAYDHCPEIAALAKMNMKQARYAEFMGDNKAVCASVNHHNLVREAIFNEEKFNHCLKVDETYRDKSLASTLGPIKDITKVLGEILELKASLYCSACSTSDSTNVDVGTNTLHMSNKFCFAFVNKYRGYLNWRYKTLQTFQNDLYQYLSCYSRDANTTVEMPYESDNGLVSSELPAWDDCSKVTSIDKVSICEPICNTFSLTSFSKVIDGDLASLRRLYNYAVTTLQINGHQFGDFDLKFDYSQTNTAVNLNDLRLKAGNKESPTIIVNEPNYPDIMVNPPKLSKSSRVLSSYTRPSRNLVYKLDDEEWTPYRKLQGAAATPAAPAAATAAAPAAGAAAAGAAAPAGAAGATGAAGDKKAPTAPAKPAPSAAAALILSKMSPELQKNEVIQKYAELLSSCDKAAITPLSILTSEEISNPRVVLKPNAAAISLLKMITKVSPKGIDPFQYKRIQLSEDRVSVIMSTKPDPGVGLDRDVIGECTAINAEVLNSFIGDTKIVITANFIPVSSDLGFLSVNNNLFIRSQPVPGASMIKWKARTKSDRITRVKNSPKDGSSAHTMSQRTTKHSKKTNRGFLSNLLTRVMF